ncbi:ornithine cyclodeaminase family protein [uncultured Pseudodesulfovibrio sp.]|uniref:ornithine cyclodeaminase family protein n=1 Tax=uncultured Pseudodesulfovibrio sp. TaxID=2035858 RepID=UPI0029C80768|nr:ornithine cyclodeaminase family protein [uncultured Pseudodesulfovibrio sp.]
MFFVSEERAKRVVSTADAIETIEDMFREYGQGEAVVFPVVMGKGPDTSNKFSMKSGLMQARGVVGLKVGSYWPGNREQGKEAHASSTLLLDPETGYPHAFVEASNLTALRTAAADAVATKYLSREDSTTLAIFCAGHQAWFELLAVHEVRPIKKVLIANRFQASAIAFAKRIRDELGLDAECAEKEIAAKSADIIVTVTAACAPLFKASWVRPGTHISAMGADSEGKQELDPFLISKSTLFTDVVQQSVSVGEYEAAYKAGLITMDQITTLGEILNGAQGRISNDEITIFDSSGMALQDLAICSLALNKACKQGKAIKI